MTARAAAIALLDADPRLTEHKALAEEVEDLLGENVDYLFKS